MMHVKITITADKVPEPDEMGWDLYWSSCWRFENLVSWSRNDATEVTLDDRHPDYRKCLAIFMGRVLEE